VVVEHPRTVDEPLCEPERAARVARQENPLGDGLVRLEDHGTKRHSVPHSSYDRPAMAKKNKKDKKGGKQDKPAAGAVEAVEAVRSAVERTFAATAGGAHSTRGRALNIAGDVAVAANRIREVLEDRVVGELKGLRSEVEGLARRVSALEVGPRGGRGAAAGSSARGRRPAAAKQTAARRKAAAKPVPVSEADSVKPAAAKRPAASRSAASKPAASRPTAKRAARKRSPTAKPPAKRRAAASRSKNAAGTTSAGGTSSSGAGGTTSGS